MSGTRGSSGLGSVSIEQIDSSTVYIKYKSDHVTQASHYMEQIKQTFRNGQCRRPLISQNVQTDRAVGIDVWVVDLGREADLGWFEGVVGREGDRKEEDTACVWGITLKRQEKSDVEQDDEKSEYICPRIRSKTR
jgi:hypothetical protein